MIELVSWKTLREIDDHDQPGTDGLTFEETARNGQDCLVTILDYLQSKSTPIPVPQLYQTEIAA